MRCQAVVGVLGLVATLVVAVLMDLDSAGLIGFVWLVHAVATLVVGYPVGVVAGRLLPADPTRAAAGWWFALAGAVAAAAIMLGSGLAGVVLYAPLGAAVAGGARASAHGAIERRLRGAPVLA